MTFSSPEVVAARMSERRQEAAADRFVAALRMARDCCTTAVSPLRRLFRRKAATSC